MPVDIVRSVDAILLVVQRQRLSIDACGARMLAAEARFGRMAGMDALPWCRSLYAIAAALQSESESLQVALDSIAQALAPIAGNCIHVARYSCFNDCTCIPSGYSVYVYARQ